MDDQQPSINFEIYYRKPKQGYGFIYRYTSPFNKNYIGQTVGTLKKRAVNIISGNGYKKCSLFWKAISKYGFLKFKVEILEEVPVHELNEREKFYIKKFNSISPHGYNLSHGGLGGVTKDVFVYSAQNGEFIEHYSSLTEASLFTGVPIETICTVISQSKRRQTHNLVFLDKYIDKYDISNLLRKNYSKVFVYDREGRFISSYNKIADAARDLQISDSCIRKVLNGTSLHASYYQFSREEVKTMPPIPKNSKTPISVCQIDPKTGKELKVFYSLSEAAQAVGLSSGSNIKKVAIRGKGLSGGYFWKINEGSTTKYERNPSSSVRDSLKG